MKNNEILQNINKNVYCIHQKQIQLEQDINNILKTLVEAFDELIKKQEKK